MKMLSSSSLETRAVSWVKGNVCFNRQRLKLGKDLHRAGAGLWKNLVLTKKENSRQLGTSWVVGGGGQAGSRAFQTRDSSESIFHLPEYACRHGY